MVKSDTQMNTSVKTVLRREGETRQVDTAPLTIIQLGFWRQLRKAKLSRHAGPVNGNGFHAQR